MPRRKTPEPLYRLCVTYVAERIQELCRPQGAFCRVLPPVVNEGLMDALQYDERPIDSLLHLLSHRLRRFKYHDYTRHPRDPILWPSQLYSMISQHGQHPDPILWPSQLYSMISQHGQHLAELSLSEFSLAEIEFCELWPVEQCTDDSALVEMLSKLPRLRRLTLYLCNVTDRVVDTIADNCSELRELKLYGERVMYDSLHRLVACTKLRTLHFKMNSIDPPFSKYSTLRLLRGLCHLESLRVPFLTDALISLPADSRLPLTEFTLYGFNPPWRCTTVLPHIVRVCPQLTCVDVCVTGEESLVALGELQALAKLALRAVQRTTIRFFRQQVEPVLRAVGRHLRTLSLSLQYVDVAAISWHCPTLIELQVEKLQALIFMDQPQDARPPVSFRQLQRLKFFLFKMNSVTSEQLCEILRGCNELIWASLESCRLTDASLMELVESGTFDKLRRLELSAMGLVSGAGLRALVTVDSELASLAVFGCNGVTQADVKDLKDYVADNHLDLDLSIRYIDDYDAVAHPRVWFF